MATALQTGVPSMQSSLRPVVLGNPNQTTDAAGIAAVDLEQNQQGTTQVASLRPIVQTIGSLNPDTVPPALRAAVDLGAGQLAADAVASETRNIRFILGAAGLGLYIGYNIPVLATYAIPPSDNNPETLHDFQIASAAFGALAGLVFAWRTN